VLLTILFGAAVIIDGDCYLYNNNNNTLNCFSLSPSSFNVCEVFSEYLVVSCLL
jgi:hypothetical protein